MYNECCSDEEMDEVKELDLDVSEKEEEENGEDEKDNTEDSILDFLDEEDSKEVRLIAMDQSSICVPYKDLIWFLHGGGYLEETQTFCKTKKSLEIMVRFFKEDVVYCPWPFELDVCLEVMYAGEKYEWGELIDQSARFILMNFRTDADWQELYNKRHDLFRTTADPEIFTEMLIRELNRRHPISVDFVTISGE